MSRTTAPPSQSPSAPPRTESTGGRLAIESEPGEGATFRILLPEAPPERRQAAPGVKVTEKNFGRDRRYPITNRFRDNGKALPAPDEKLVARAGRASADAFEG